MSKGKRRSLRNEYVLNDHEWTHDLVEDIAYFLEDNLGVPPQQDHRIVVTVDVVERDVDE